MFGLSSREEEPRQAEIKRKACLLLFQLQVIAFLFPPHSAPHQATESVMEKVDLPLKEIYFGQKESGLHTDRNTLI